jgi:Flp pilus assembly protein TadG
VTTANPAKRRLSRQSGVGLVEFSIAGIATVSLLICTVQLGLAMWTYHSLAYAARETNRYVSMHGRSCLTGGNGCGIFVADVANKLKSNAPNIPDTQMNMTLTSASGSTVVNCNPLSTCESNTTQQWPPTSHQDNWTGQYVTLTASTTMQSMIVALWYGWSGQRINTITLSTTSKVMILF